MKPQSSNSVKCVRDIRDWPPEKYLLPNDGRKAKRKCEQRQRLAMWLATFADGDGSRVEVGTKRMYETLGMSRAQLFVYLDDLKKLGVLVNEGRTTLRGTAARRLNVQALAGQESGIGETKSLGLGDQESGIGDQESGIGAQESGIHPDTTVTHRHTPTHTDLEKATTYVGVLIRKFTIQEKEPPRISGSKEKSQLDALAKRSREIFAHAGDVWLRQHPWDSNTKFPFLSFISGFDGYAAMTVIADNEADRQKQMKADREATDLYYGSKQPVENIPAEYIKTLPAEDQDFIAKVKAATTVQEIPKGAREKSMTISKSYWDFRTEQRQKQEREDKEAAEDLFKSQ